MELKKIRIKGTQQKIRELEKSVHKIIGDDSLGVSERWLRRREYIFQINMTKEQYQRHAQELSYLITDLGYSILTSEEQK